MHSFIQQFAKARLNSLRLIYDGVNDRWLVTNKPHWQTWYKHSLVKKFA